MQVNHDFDAEFKALTGYPPLKWQCRLFKRFVAGDMPPSITLPTGLGKTAIIPIWLIALAHLTRANSTQPPLPRRLVYVVNRRTVVDQATDAAERIRQIIANPSEAEQLEGAACRLRDALTKMSGDRTGVPLAVSTLRGELADNGEWKLNPARPAIIIGTIDMIGSKLLFSGYGDGRYGRAHHAGLIGQDALIVHDEAHLEPAFDELLTGIGNEQGRTGEARPIRVMRLSATARGGGTEGNGGRDTSSPLGIEDEDRLDPVVSQRLGARKSLTIVDADKGKVAPRIAKEALRLSTSPSRVLVYVRSPDAVAQIAEAIEKALGNGGETRVARLTGTIRGHERDQLAESEVFRAFKSGTDRSKPLAHTVYLVSTSAGEVGADWDADHLVCDLNTLDSMAQRFGRVNRLGGDGRSAQLVVVIEPAKKNRNKAARENEGEQAKEGDGGNGGGETKAGEDGNAGAEDGKPASGKEKAPSAYEAAILRTGDILRRVADDGGDVSPAGLRCLMNSLSDEEKRDAFSPAPTILPATDILFDHWSLTSIGWAKGPDGRWRDALLGRHAIEPYLHGVAEWEPPETHVAWRADIALLAAAGSSDDNGADQPCSHDDLEEVFDAFPLRSAEQLRERTDRVQAELRKIAERLQDTAPSRTAEPSEDTDSADPSSDGVDGRAGEGVAAAAKKRRPFDSNPWVVLMRGGSVSWARLEDLAPDDNNEAKVAQRELAFATIVLPVEAGGLDGGMLKGDKPAPTNTRSLDAAEIIMNGAGARQRLVNGRPLLGGDEFGGVARATIPLARDGDEDAEQDMLEYVVARGQEREPGGRVLLDVHNAAVGQAAQRIAEALGLSVDVASAVALAGRLHDLGKGRDRWQRYANNPRPSDLTERYDLIAKNRRYRDPRRALAGYRHELGSLLDAAIGPVGAGGVGAAGAASGGSGGAASEVANHSQRDLVLHLIAAHHGWARPHFEPRHFDPGDPGKPRPTADNERLAVETMQRFGRLQQRYGRWGLAWLESILRCADAAASEGGTGVPRVAFAASDGVPARQDGTSARASDEEDAR